MIVVYGIRTDDFDLGEFDNFQHIYTTKEVAQAAIDAYKTAGSSHEMHVVEIRVSDSPLSKAVDIDFG